MSRNRLVEIEGVPEVGNRASCGELDLTTPRITVRGVTGFDLRSGESGLFWPVGRDLESPPILTKSTAQAPKVKPQVIRLSPGGTI